MQSRKIAEHALAEFWLARRLVFDVNEEERIRVLEARPCQEINLMTLAAGEIGEDFLVENLIESRCRCALSSGRNSSMNSTKKVVSSCLKSRSWSISSAKCRLS
jgi:hypothetical protein